MLKSKKAITPILATLLLIVIAVAAIVVTYAWVMTYLSSAGEHAGVILYKSNINFYGSGTKIDIDIGNSGTADTKIIQVYVGNSSTTLQNQTITPSSIPLAAGSIERATINYPWKNGTTYYFKIISSTGQALEFPEQSPTS